MTEGPARPFWGPGPVHPTRLCPVVAPGLPWRPGESAWSILKVAVRTYSTPASCSPIRPLSPASMSTGWSCRSSSLPSWRPNGTIPNWATSPVRPCGISMTCASSTAGWTRNSRSARSAARSGSNSTTSTRRCCLPGSGWATTTRASCRWRAAWRPRAKMSSSSARTCRCGLRPPRSGWRRRSTAPSCRWIRAGPGWRSSISAVLTSRICTSQAPWNAKPPVTFPATPASSSPRPTAARLAASSRTNPSSWYAVTGRRSACGAGAPSSASRSTCCSIRRSASCRSAAGPAPASPRWPCAPGSRRSWSGGSTGRSSCSGRSTRSAGRNSVTCPGRKPTRWARGLRPSTTPCPRSPPRTSSTRSSPGTCSRSCR
jgi:hypothetical protein